MVPTAHHQPHAGHFADDEPPEEDQFGRMVYLRKCSELGISPVSQIMKFLEMRDMHIHHYGLGLKGTLALASAMEHCTSFVISNYRTSRAYAQANSVITSVRLTNNNIPDEGLLQIVKIVSSKPHIVELDLSGNKIGSSTCKALAEWLGKRWVEGVVT
eukprot:351965-Chlamydomonas_euryale.AAC.25